MILFLGFGVRITSKVHFYKIDKPKGNENTFGWLKIQRKFSAEAWIEMADLTSQFYAMNPDGIAQNVMKAWEYHWKVAWRVSKEIKKDFQKGIQYANTAIDLKSLNTKQTKIHIVKAFLYMSTKNMMKHYYCKFRKKIYYK